MPELRKTGNPLIPYEHGSRQRVSCFIMLISFSQKVKKGTLKQRKKAIF